LKQFGLPFVIVYEEVSFWLFGLRGTFYQYNLTAETTLFALPYLDYMKSFARRAYVSLVDSQLGFLGRIFLMYSLSVKWIKGS